MLSVTCKAILFDMDGTLVDSTQCIETIWGRWADRRGIDLNRILSVSHGRRTVDTLREVTPHLDIEREAMQLDAEEVEAREGIKATDGAALLLELLPHDRWAIVTSASRALAEVRLRCAGLPIPTVLIGADDVTEGKPNPAGYLTAAKRIGVAPDQCLVIEDTPAGILAGRAAGMQVLALSTTYPTEDLLGADCVRNFRDIKIAWTIEGDLHLLDP